MTRAAALQGLRQFRTGIGPLASSPYGFQSPDGSNCLFLTGRVAGCGAASEGIPGTHWIIAGGWPAIVGNQQIVDVPSVLVGLVSDA